MRVTSDTLGARTGRPRRPEAEEGGQNIKHNDTDNTSAQGRRLPGARWRTTTTVGSPQGLVKEGLVVRRLAQARPMKGGAAVGPPPTAKARGCMVVEFCTPQGGGNEIGCGRSPPGRLNRKKTPGRARSGNPRRNPDHGGTKNGQTQRAQCPAVGDGGNLGALRALHPKADLL